MVAVTKVELPEFKLAIAALEKGELSSDAKSVIGKIKEGIQFREWGIDTDEGAFFVAKVELNARGLLKMTKRNGVWWIDDLVSAAKGCGGALARAGIAHARTDYGAGLNKTIQLISLSEASTGFWEHYGFETGSGVEARSSIGMTLKLPNAVQATSSTKQVIRLRGG